MKNITSPILLTQNLKLVIVRESFSKKVLAYYIRNRDSFKIWEPGRQEDFYTSAYHKTALKEGLKRVKDGKEYRFMIFEKDDFELNKVIGVLSFSSIVQGPFLSCFVGYSIDNKIQNKGYMTQALKAGIDFIFNTIGLHRIEANIMPNNIPSLKVATKLGFKNEGLSPKYLKINGTWEDHVHMVLRNVELES
ncbi:MAG: GNAT family N-acetyltransferase [Spirochaetales bacterium]|nr:GNAT family N-acetyltransferase [Spirochaetales bacterium]